MPLRIAGPSSRTLSGALNRQAHLSTPAHEHATRRRTFSHTPLAGDPGAKGLLAKLKESVVELPHHVAEFEGVRDARLRMLLFGKPGSGKGTLSARLVKEYDIAFVSTGDVLRKEIAAKSAVGSRAEQVVARGELVSDELMLEIVKTELDRLQGKSWIVDGFPRTLHQGELLDRTLNKEGRPLNMIVHLNVPDSVILDRIEARWVHLPSGRVYNTEYSAPQIEGKDDVTGEPLAKRPDDTAKVFSKRLQAYYRSTAPLLEFFAKAYPGSLHTLTGSTSDELWPQLQRLVEPYGLTKRPSSLPQDDVEEVRKGANDLTDPADIEREGAGRGRTEKAAAVS